MGSNILYSLSAKTFITMNPLIKKFKEYGTITAEIETELAKKVKFQNRLKGDFFLKQGQIVSSLFLIERGLVRSFYIKEDREINSWFGSENIILGSILPLFFKVVSAENIQFLEDSVVYYIEGNDLEELYRKYNEMNTIGKIMTEEYCKILEDRVMSLQTQSAEERYQTLLKFQPDATQRISLDILLRIWGFNKRL